MRCLRTGCTYSRQIETERRPHWSAPRSIRFLISGSIPALIERFGSTMREKFSTGSVPFRKAYLRSLIDAVEVDDHQIRIKGNKELLEKAVLATQSGQSWCSQTSTRWRARRDSNSRPLPSEGNA